MQDKKVKSFIQNLIEGLPDFSCQLVDDFDATLEKIIEQTSSGTALTGEEKDDLIQNKKNFIKATRLNDFDRAIEFQKEVLRLTAKQNGSFDATTVFAMSHLASSYLGNHQPTLALEQLLAAYKIASERLPEIDTTLQDIRKKIAACHKAMKQQAQVQNLSAVMGHFHLSQTDSSESNMRLKLRKQRQAKIAHRAFEKRQFERAVHFFSQWMHQKETDGEWPLTDELVHVSAYGQALLSSGRMNQASEIFKHLILRCQAVEESAEKGLKMKQALIDYAECLEKLGQGGSALMTRDLAVKISAHGISGQ